MNEKGLVEKRADLMTEMEGILEKSKVETRALNEEESKKFGELRAEIENIDATLKAMEEMRAMENKTPAKAVEKESIEVLETRSFSNYIKRQCGVFVEQRDGEQNFNIGNNGAIIPTTIVNRIITTVKEQCPILQRATMYNIKGTLKIPVYGLSNTTHDITVAYQTEFTDITADAGQFTSVDLSGYLAGALSLIGKSVINNGEVDVVSFVVAEMGRKIALFLEKELINGTSEKATGVLSTTTNLNAGSTSAISADNLIDLQAKIPTIYQGSCVFIMAPATFTAIKKLKDKHGQYLLQPSLTQEFPYTILGKPVYLSDNMPAIGNANKAVLYGDLSGFAVNMRENISIQVLQEKYATAHAIGIVSWFEFDSKVIDAQKLATLTMS